MAIVTYATYVPDVTPFAPGCPALTVVDALRKAAISFFYKSLTYRKWVTAFDLTINTTTYAIDTKCPTETEVAQVMMLYCSGVGVTELTHEQFLARDPAWPTLTGTNAQFYTLLDNKDSINITPKPTATVTAAFTMQLAVCPTLVSTGVEQVHFEEWKESIIDGALARILSMPGNPWTDLKEADRRHQRASAGVVVAKSQVNKGNTVQDLTVQMRRWV